MPAGRLCLHLTTNLLSVSIPREVDMLPNIPVVGRGVDEGELHILPLVHSLQLSLLTAFSTKGSPLIPSK